MVHYVCPICKGELAGEHCARCNFSVEWHDGVAGFFSTSSVAKRYREIGDYYDDLYSSRSNVWEEVAFRGVAFRRLLAELIVEHSPRTYLDIGCGEGFQLSETSVAEKFGTEISSAAVKAASQRTEAALCRACAEELPYPADYFDLVTSVGVTEHCLDDRAATMEAYRVLRPKGRYLMGVTLKPNSLKDRVRVKIEDYLYPSFRPAALGRWAAKKYFRRGGNGQVLQPVMHSYTSHTLRSMVESAGFRIVDIVTRRDRQELIAAFRVYVLEK